MEYISKIPKNDAIKMKTIHWTTLHDKTINSFVKHTTSLF